jgi:hypothetical protein
VSEGRGGGGYDGYYGGEGLGRGLGFGLGLGVGVRLNNRFSFRFFIGDNFEAIISKEVGNLLFVHSHRFLVQGAKFVHVHGHRCRDCFNAGVDKFFQKT